MFRSIGCVNLSHVNSNELEYIASNVGSDQTIIALSQVEDTDEYWVVGCGICFFLQSNLLQMVEYVAVYFLVEDWRFEKRMWTQMC